MKAGKIRLTATLVALLLLLVLTGLTKGAAAAGSGCRTTDDLNGKKLAGIRSFKIANENGEVFFNTLLGIDLGGYEGVDTVDELVYALESGRVDAIWCPDVMADYLLRTVSENNLIKLSAPEDTSGAAEDGARLEFALALRSEEETLCRELDAVIGEIKADRTMETLLVAYVWADEPMERYEKQGIFAKRTIKVGVTGTLPPLDCYDADGTPCGFSVALMEELEKRTGYHFTLVKVTPQDALTALASGKVDILLGCGTGKNTTPGKKEYITTRGYYTMQQYSYLAIQ